MEKTLISLSSKNSFIINLTGIITALLPILLLLALIIHYAQNMELTLIYKIFKFPKGIKEYKKTKNILKLLGYITIQLIIFGVICYMIMFYYFIYYGIFLPRSYGINTVWYVNLMYTQ